MKNIQMTTTPQFNGNSNSVHIVLEGELLLKHIHELAAEITVVIHQYEDITIALKNIVNIDLACIQLLLAAKQTAIASKKKIACQVELPAEVENVLNHAGLNNFPDIVNK
jgi:ABC-type transporter Mla MlaB component